MNRAPNVMVIVFLVLGFLICEPAIAQEKELDRAESLVRELHDLIGQAGFDKALPIAREVVSIREKILGPDHPALAYSLVDLGVCYQSTGRLDRAEEAFGRALSIREAALGPRHQDVAGCLAYLGDLHREKGDLPKAADLYERALDIVDKESSPYLRMFLLRGLARTYSDLDDLNRAEALFREVLAEERKVFGPDHWSLSASHIDLGMVNLQRGDYEKARYHYEIALRLREADRGPDDPGLAIIHGGLGSACKALGDLGAAETHYRRAIELEEKWMEPDNPFLAMRFSSLGMLYQETGRLEEAETLFHRALETTEKILGPDHEDLIPHLTSLAMVCLNLNLIEKSEGYYQRALALTEKAYSPDHPETARKLDSLAGLYLSRGRTEEALPLLERALAINQKALGPEHLETASILESLADAYKNLADYQKAARLFQRAKDIQEKLLGPDHPNLGVCLSGLASVYHKMGKYDEAESLYERDLEIIESAFGPDHHSLATSLNNLADLHILTGDFTAGEKMLERSLAVTEKEYGKNHSSTAKILNNLGMLYLSMAEYDRAGDYLDRAADVINRVYGPDSSQAAVTLGNLAWLLFSRGDYAGAEGLYKKALDLQEKSLGERHPDLATNLVNLASLYMAIGDFDQARNHLERALDVLENAYGPDHPQAIVTKGHLAWLYDLAGLDSRAESCHRQALDGLKKIFGPSHPRVAAVMLGLGWFYYERNQFDSARSLIDSALSVAEKAYDPGHPDLAQFYFMSAVFHQNLGELSLAENLYSKSLDIFNTTLGPGHPYAVFALNGQAQIAAAKGMYKKAFGLYMDGVEIDRTFIDQIMGFTSEDRKAGFLSTRQAFLHGFLSLVFRHLKDDPASVRAALDLWLRRKGLILEAQRRFQEALVYSGDPQLTTIFQELARTRAGLSRLVFAGSGKETLNQYRKRLADFQVRIEALESDLSRASQAFAKKKKMARAEAAQLADALPDKSVLLEFARIDMYHFLNQIGAPTSKPPHYLVFILPAGMAGESIPVDLGPADIIDKNVTEFKKDILGPREEQEIKRAGNKLYQLVFAPIVKHLGEASEIFISPDGNLNLIPFEILPGPDGRYLIEDFTFNYLSAGREVLTFDRNRQPREGGRALMIGDPDFDLTGEEKDDVLRTLSLESDSRLFTKKSRDMRGMLFTSLPGTKKEVTDIRDVLDSWRVELHTGSEAVEEVLTEAESPTILHLATHGFFLTDKQFLKLTGQGMVRDLVINEGPLEIRAPHPVNPLLRSGLALAGANHALRSNDPGKSDGLLTAEKVLSLRLQGTELVVLSACNTGLGEVMCGEGVYGLRRAFTQAGAKALVMSMWPVPDKETQELMTAFYKNFNQKKMNRCQALRQAALDRMKAVKLEFGTTNPLLWGAFIYLGAP